MKERDEVVMDHLPLFLLEHHCRLDELQRFRQRMLWFWLLWLRIDRNRGAQCGSSPCTARVVLY